jgi:hypothetical protein
MKAPYKKKREHSMLRRNGVIMRRLLRLQNIGKNSKKLLRLNEMLRGLNELRVVNLPIPPLLYPRGQQPNL